MSSIYSIANLKKSFTFYVVLGFVNKNCVGLVKKNAAPTNFAHNKNRGAKKTFGRYKNAEKALSAY